MSPGIRRAESGPLITRPYRATDGCWKCCTEVHPSGVADFSGCSVTYLYDCDDLREKNYLRDSRYVSVYEQVAMFLLTVGHNCRNFLVQDVFQHSGETVSRHFHTVLQAFAAFAKEMIKPPSLDETPSEILRNMKYYPWFKDCIGAIDGTHIPAVVPVD